MTLTHANDFPVGENMVSESANEAEEANQRRSRTSRAAKSVAKQHP